MSALRAWLDQLGLGKYAELFVEHDIDLDVLPDLSDADLKDLGVSLGDRRRILKAAAQADLATSSTGIAKPAPGARLAERRHLTVMFVDLVGSTRLSTQLDPEDLRALISSYQQSVAAEVTRFEGHIANYMGDGVLVYFGWPQAHEDEAERAVRAGLSILQAMVDMKTPQGEPLAARIGIATGLVVVGNLLGEGLTQDEAVVGETPNLAARLQSVAQPGQVVIGETTRRLVGDLFELEDLGVQSLKGIATPVPAFAVLRERPTESRFEARQTGGLLTMVGREEELALLLERWRQAKAGDGQMVLLTGEAGIGKSRITRALIDAAGADDRIQINYQCSPYHTDSALHPAIQQLHHAARFAADDGLELRLDKLERLLALAMDDIAEAAPLIAALLGFDGEARYGTLDLAPQQRRDRTLQALAAQVTGLARGHPVLFIVEDAHWIDPTTVELIELLLDQIATARVLVVITARPTFDARFGGHPIVTRLTLPRLGRDLIAAITRQLSGGKGLPGELLAEIAEKTDGVPLFVEELTKAVLESGLLQETETAGVLDGPLRALAVPSSLQDSLMARLDRQQPVKEVAQTAACIGREFGHTLLAALSPLSETALQQALDRLIAAEIVYRRGMPPDATYSFKHALVRDAAYESLLKGKRQTLHKQLLQVLEKHHDGTAPEVLAHHATEAGLVKKAIDYWQQAGDHAARATAYRESISHLSRGLGLVTMLPDSRDKDRQELALSLSLGPALMATKGWVQVEIERNYRRAHELAKKVGQPQQVFAALWGQWIHSQSRGKLQVARDLTCDLLGLADQLADSGLRLQALHSAWTTELLCGNPQATRSYADQGVHLYDRNIHGSHAGRFGDHDPGVCSHDTLGEALWLLGYAARALDVYEAGIRLASDLNHPVSLVIALNSVARFYRHRRQPTDTLEKAEAAITLCSEQGISPQFLATARMLRGWAIGEIGDTEEGLAECQSGLEAFRATGVARTLNFYLAVYGELLGRAGQPGAGLDVLEEALEIVKSSGERWWEAEIHRLQGELMLDQPGAEPSQSEACFQRALEVARTQDCKALEQRASMSLARLWSAAGEGEKAHAFLAPVYAWFTEGSDTPDLKDAKALLDQLA